jgi:hypothetical protein
MLLDYATQRRWIWFSGALFLLALGVYIGLHAAPGGRGALGLAGLALLGAAILLGILRLTRGLAALGIAGLGGAGLLLLGLYGGQCWAGLDGPAGNSVVGMWYGIVAAACMVFCGLLSAHRLLPGWWWLGCRTWWLKGHIWLGLLSGPLVYFHAAGRWGGFLEGTLWVLLFLVIGSGLLGLWLQWYVPRRLTLRLSAEVPYEQIPHVCVVLRADADRLLASVPETALASPGLRQIYAAVIRPFLGPDYDRSSPLARPSGADAVFKSLRGLPGADVVEKQVGGLETLCIDRRQIGEQERLHLWLHAWLFAHLPLSVALLVLTALHAVVSLSY